MRYLKPLLLSALLVSFALPVHAAGTFLLNKAYYPSPTRPDALPDGTMIKSSTKPDVYYVQSGKKSLILNSIVNRWLGENHFFKPDIIHVLTDAEVNAYPTVIAVNPIYIGKVLQAPNGTQYYIDDKLRKRLLSAAVRKALKFPAKNLYATSDLHLKQFVTGKPLTDTKKQPGGMDVYNGNFHGGTIWRIEENSVGQITKRLYESDYLYEADGNPDESERVAVSNQELASYVRGPNIERYPNGWVVGLNTNKYLVEGGALRLIGSPALFSAMGYKDKYVLTKFPEFLVRYPKAEAIAAFKNITAPAAIAKGAPAPAPSSSYALVKVRPGIRTLIAQVNDIALPVYDRQLTSAENVFWVNYLYQGEVTTQQDLVAKMHGAVLSGHLPTLTNKNAVIDPQIIQNKWFPYMFYFVWQKEPSESDREYWYGRIKSGDRDTIAKLGETLQWMKDTTGQTSK